MDQQAASLEQHGHDPHAVDPSRIVPVSPLPFGPLGLALSVFGIAVGGILVCCLVAVAALLVLVANIGTEATSEFFQDLRFDIPLKTRLGAGVVSSLYIGVAVSTVTMAAIRDRRAWPGLVALSPKRKVWRPVILLAVVTLAYAAVATFVMVKMQDSRLATMGPTDLVLITTIFANLVVLAPIAEELLFRGWIYTALRRSLGPWPGGLITAALFAAIHYDASHKRVFLVLPLAVALGVVREISGSIRPTIALHATYNLIIVAITLANA